jgi:hypothetical protein
LLKPGGERGDVLESGELAGRVGMVTVSAGMVAGVVGELGEVGACCSMLLKS